MGTRAPPSFFGLLGKIVRSFGEERAKRPMGMKARFARIASNAMTRTQTIICFSVREPGAAFSPLAIRFECVHNSVFC